MAQTSNKLKTVFVQLRSLQMGVLNRSHPPENNRDTQQWG
jgi:hypothetical protein